MVLFVSNKTVCAWIRCLFTLVFLVICGQTQGQTQTLDSLLSSYNKTSDSVARKNLSIQIGRHYQAAKAYNKAIEYYQHALLKRDDKTDLLLLRSIAYCYHELDASNQEIATYQEILKLSERTADTLRMIETTQTLSGLMERTGDYASAVTLNKKILEVAKLQQNYLWASIALNNLGYLYSVLKDEATSVIYFNESYNLANQSNSKLPADQRATILINLGVANTRLKKYKEAEQYLTEAYDIRMNGNDVIKQAEALNYLASFDYIQGNIEKARKRVRQSMDWVKQEPPSEEKDNALLSCYKLMAQIMLKANNVREYRNYVEAANALQQQIIEHERRSIKLLLEQQVEVERKEGEYRLLLSENEVNSFRLRQSELEREKKARELEIQLQQLAILKKENELQLSRYYNQRLENEKISQQLQLVQEKATVAEQEQSIELLQKETELQNLTLEQRKRDIDVLELEKRQSAQIRLYGSIIIALLLLLLIIGIIGYRFRVKRSRLLALQYETIRQLNEETQAQNEELTTMNEQMALRSNELQEMNVELKEAQQIVKDQNEKLKIYANNLEGEVDHRTKEVIQKNLELLHHTGQLEQFTYAVSHNIRAPIARLLGLVGLLDVVTAQERDAILEMIRTSAVDLDKVVNDLNEVLNIKNSNEKLEEVNIETVVDKVLLGMNGKIQEDVVIQKNLQVKHLRGIGKYFENVVENLVDNALKYRSMERECVITITSIDQADRKEFSVGDNGIGIDLERYGNKLFGFYKRLDTVTSGKGLGLYMVKTQVEAMHGKIVVESKLDKGSIFRIQFPK